MKKNDIVMIKNHNGSGKEINEGKAKLIKQISMEPERWEVEFLNEPGILYKRIIW